MKDTVLPGFLDAHVHLALVDPAELLAGGIARVLDLGGWAPPPDATSAYPEVAFARQFLTAPGGYPGRQKWAPAGSVHEVANATDAATAVDAQLDAGASVVKVALNAEAGPVLSAEVLRTIVTRAHERGAPVAAHAEGVGQAVRAFSAGVDVLAHTPFSERLVDELVDAMAERMTWISTLDIHGWGTYDDDFARASDNLRRFHARGGRVLYGTDLGNGALPLGLNRRELDALLAVGMSPDEILGTLTAGYPGRADGSRMRASRSSGNSRVTLIPGAIPSRAAEFTEWLCTARAVTRTELEERE
jgi:imidazolonepropionase-like amidohydrolase